MKREALVTHDLDRDTRTSRTHDLLDKAGIGKVHVLTTGTYEPTLVLFESARDAYKGHEAMCAAGWDVSRVSDDHGNPPAFWVRHPSPFATTQSLLTKGRVFEVDSPCPTDVEYAQHQNGIVFGRMRYGQQQPRWRAMVEYQGDGSEHDWPSLNGSYGDASVMVEVFLPRSNSFSVEDLRHPVWRAVEAVATQERQPSEHGR